MMRKRQSNDRLKFRALQACAAVLLLLALGYGAENKSEEGQFSIYMAGKEIGREKFSIKASGDTLSSSSTLTFREPGQRRRNIKIETELIMNSRFVPLMYQLRTDVDGKQGAVKGVFGSGQASFEYISGADARKTGLIVGDGCLMLDTNVFHHFIFVARLFDFDRKDELQSMEVVVPQEAANGLLKISDAGHETVSVLGKKRQLHHLKVNTGAAQVDLWVDDQHVLYKIALPANRLEVVRSS